MIKIVYPPYPFKIEMKDGKEHIFDPLRKKWVRLTPEEWVRQNFLQYLLQTKQYPASLIAIEKEIGTSVGENASVVCLDDFESTGSMFSNRF